MCKQGPTRVRIILKMNVCQILVFFTFYMRHAGPFTVAEMIIFGNDHHDVTTVVSRTVPGKFKNSWGQIPNFGVVWMEKCTTSVEFGTKMNSWNCYNETSIGCWCISQDLSCMGSGSWIRVDTLAIKEKFTGLKLNPRCISSSDELWKCCNLDCKLVLMWMVMVLILCGV